MVPFLPTDTVYHYHYNTFSTIQQISLTTTVRRAVDQVYFVGFSSGTTINLGGASGIPSNQVAFDIDSSANTWANYVNSVTPCSGGSISVVKFYTVPNIAYFGVFYNITYNCPQNALTHQVVNCSTSTKVLPSALA